MPAAHALSIPTFLGGHGFLQNGNGIAVDNDGHAFVIGFTDARDFPTTAGSAQPAAPGKPNPFATHAFVSEVSSSGSHLVYSTYLGGSSGEMGQAIALDSEGNAFVTGDTSVTGFSRKKCFPNALPHSIWRLQRRLRRQAEHKRTARIFHVPQRHGRRT